MRIAACLLLLTGCASTLRVTSSTPGARVLVDGADTGEVTPTELTSWDVGSGEHEITVAGAPPRKVTAKASVKAIVASILLWPLALPNLMRGFRDLEPRELHFDQGEGEAGVDSEHPRP